MSAPTCVSVRASEDHDVVVLAGELDLATAPQLGPVVHALLAAGRRHLVLDLDEVTFLDGFALQMLLLAQRDVARCHGTLCVRPHRLLERLLGVSGARLSWCTTPGAVP